MTRARSFTLIELLLVVFILAAVAATAASLTTQVDEQFRYDDTKARREEIRRAILGDPSRTANGQPVISGFAADVGRLPNDLSELVTNSGLPSWTWNESAKQGAGWRGPYLRATTERRPDGTERFVFRDGWANLGGSANPELPDFGWIRSGGGATDSLGLHSLGSDDSAAVTAELYAQEWPNGDDTLVAAADWKADITGMQVLVNLGTLDPATHRLVVRTPVDGQLPAQPFPSWPLSDPADEPTLSAAGVSAGSGTATFDFPALSSGDPRWIAAGVRSLQLLDATDGTPVSGAARALTLLPRTAPPDLSQTPYVSVLP